MDVLTKIIKASKSKPVNLYIIGDVHIGSSLHDKKSFRKTIETIENDDNAYWIGIGDYIEGITHRDNRFNPASVDRGYSIRDLSDLSRKEMQEYYRLVKPIKDKCIAKLIGNHEESFVKYNNSNPMWVYETLAEQTGITLGYTGYVILKFKLTKTTTIQYTLFLNHGSGGGGTEPGYADRKAYKNGRWRDVDISIMGHIHTAGYKHITYYRVAKNNKIVRYKRHFISNPCFLLESKQKERGYFEGNAHASPADIGYTKITFNFGATKEDSLIDVNQKLF